MQRLHVTHYITSKKLTQKHQIPLIMYNNMIQHSITAQAVRQNTEHFRQGELKTKRTLCKTDPLRRQ